LSLQVGVLYGSPEVTSGGNALKYYASARVDLRRKETLDENGKAIGIRVKATVKKNKTFAPYR
jgi:recombination protein RecA